MRSALTAVLALLPAACKADLDWQDSPGSGPTYLEDYKAAYFRDLGDRFVGSWNPDRLLEELRTTRILYLGDNHEDVGLHQRQIRLLGDLRAAGLRPILGLESVGVQDEPFLAGFMEGQTMTRLRQELRQRWSGSWLDPGQVDSYFYQTVLEEARSSRWPVFALEPTPRLPLPSRDAVIADSILRAAHRNPDRLIVVIVGQAHLLGEGRLIERVGLPHVAIGAQPPPGLARSMGSGTDGAYLRTVSGVLFFEEMVASSL